MTISENSRAASVTDMWAALYVIARVKVGCDGPNLIPGEGARLAEIALKPVKDGQRDTGAKIASLTVCVTALDPTNDPNGANNCATATVKIVGKR